MIGHTQRLWRRRKPLGGAVSAEEHEARRSVDGSRGAPSGERRRHPRRPSLTDGGGGGSVNAKEGVEARGGGEGAWRQQVDDGEGGVSSSLDGVELGALEAERGAEVVDEDVEEATEVVGRSWAGSESAEPEGLYHQAQQPKPFPD